MISMKEGVGGTIVFSGRVEKHDRREVKEQKI